MTGTGLRRASFRSAKRSATVTAFDEGEGIFEGVAVAYGVVDDYRTAFAPGCFTASLRTKMPGITWGHSWIDPVGLVVDYKESRTALRVVGQLDDPDAVPRAKQAWAQLRSGSMAELSVGFADPVWRSPTPAEVKALPGLEMVCVKAQLDEVAIVLRGAVPGAAVTGTRTGHLVKRRESSVPDSVIEAGRHEALVREHEALVAANAALDRREQMVAVDQILEEVREGRFRDDLDPPPPPSSSPMRGWVDEAVVERLAARVAAGTMTEAEAKAELRRNATPTR